MNAKYTRLVYTGKMKFTPYFSSILISSALLFSVSCKEKKNTFEQKGKSGPTTVDVIIAKSEQIGNQVEVNGSVVANEFAELRPEVSGLLTFLNIPEGASVAKGTVMARINSADLEAQVNKLTVQLELAEKTVIRAPFTGVVGLRRVSAGSYVTPTSVLATMQQLSQLRIDFMVPESYQKYVQKGSTVEVLLDKSGGERQLARIIATEPQISESSRNLTVRAVLNGGNVTPGSFVKVYLKEGADKSSILIPANCIIPDSRSKKVVTVKDGKAFFVNVETGARQEEYIEVTQGLSVGDSVVVSGVLFTRPDAPVKVRSVRDLKVVNK